MPVTRNTRIVIAIVVTIAVVWLAGAMLYKVARTPVTIDSAGGPATGRQEGELTVPHADTPPHADGSASSDDRDAEAYERAYTETPPLIPHEVKPEMQAQGICLGCHRHGGYAQEFNAFAPATPHPELSPCQECHLTE